MNDISIIIVNYNTKKLLEKLLTSLLIQAVDLKLEIFVVDNGSTDRSAEMVESDFPYVRLIRNSQNLGFAKANNQAIRQCQGRYILLLNSDAELLDDTLYLMIEFMDTHKDAGIIGPRLLNPDGSIQFSCHNVPALFRTFIEMSFINRIVPLDVGDMLYRFGYDRIREVGYVSGACLMVRREIIEEVGLLDERFFMYAEEADWCIRVKKAGFKIYFIPQARVIHSLRGSIKNCDLLDISREKLKSSYLLFEKHYGRFKARLLCGLFFLCFVTRLLIWIGDSQKRKLYLGLISESIALAT